MKQDERKRNAEYYAANKKRENERCREYHARNREKRLAVKAAWRDANREAGRVDARARYWGDPEQSRQYHREWRKNSSTYPETNRAWREQNAEREKERLRRWAQENKPRLRAKNAQRRARKNRATPEWADLEAIAEIYAVCASVSQETGIAHEVDHIVPLKGVGVCGLHVHQNLRIVTRTENRRKNNRLEAEFEHSWFPDHADGAEGFISSG